MIKNISIRWRLTLMSALLLSLCCAGLTVVMNYSAFNLADSIDATKIVVPATSTIPSLPMEDAVPVSPTIEIQNAKSGFRIQSIFYMLLVIGGGSALTYYISGKALKPLDILNNQVKSMNVHTLSNTLQVPPTHDEISELTASFNDMSNKLNDAFMTQKRFSASAAHELRTPLAVLQSKVDVFKKKNNHTTTEYETLITTFEKQVNRLRELIGNLLDMTNMEDNEEKSVICLHDLIEDIINELSVLAKDKNVFLSLNCDDSTVFANLDLLYRAIYNLIENGINYNIDGGQLQIDVMKTAKEHATILFKDSGIGIPNEMKKHIFEPFYRVDASRSRRNGGAGLGLSIVDSIIRKQGGTVTVFDNETGGSTFKIKI